MSRAVYIVFLLLCITANGQERKPLQGRVVSGNMPVHDVFVINKATAAETKSDMQGNFTIHVKAGDIIVVYSNRTDVRQFVISEASFKEVPYVVEVIVSAYELDEVVVESTGITSESLGLAPAGQPRYTPAEKKLFTAEDGTDAIFNAISGRTKILKKAVETEKKEGVIEYLEGLYTDSELTEEFKIPADKVRDFLFYAAEDKELAPIIKDKNEALVKLKMIDISKRYLEAIKGNE